MKRSSVLGLEGASLCEFALAAGGLGEDILAVVAGHYCLCMAEDDCGLVAASAFDVHKI